jgi:Domain of unknown function (DUF4157)
MVPDSAGVAVTTAILPRKCPCGARHSHHVCESCNRGGRALQRKARGHTGRERAAVATVDNVCRSPGEPLEPAACVSMEGRVGRDVRHVRVHTDREAGGSARAMDAAGYTVRTHIVCAPNRYAPSRSGGRRLLAHDLTHVVQHDVAPAAHTAAGLAIAPDDSVAEREAESNVTQIDHVSGPRMVAASIASTSPTLMRQAAEEDETGCRYEPIGMRCGRYRCHMDFAHSISGESRERRVTTQEGLSVDVDAMDRARNLYDVKTGYRWWLSNHASLQERISPTRERCVDQSEDQMAVVNRRGRALTWYFNERPVADFFIVRQPLQPPVMYGPIDCDCDSDG